MNRTMKTDHKSLLIHIKNSTNFMRSLHRSHVDNLGEVSVDDLTAEKPRSGRRQARHQWREEDELYVRDP